LQGLRVLLVLLGSGRSGIVSAQKVILY
jgi:hypothetical protein